MKYLVAAVFAVSFAVAFIAFHKAHAIGIEYQEGIDINIDTSCEPPTESLEEPSAGEAGPGGEEAP